MTKNQSQKSQELSKYRPPIVAVLGHVDHGKTTLLDAMRESNVADREAGGITQGIGASTITTKEGKKITFLDTPGHALFSNMRERGAQAADIAILVVAADDGVMPQTKEAIKFIKEEQIPYIVAFTKIDMKTADVARAIEGLTKEEVFLDGKGGDVSYVEVSGKTGEGVDDLLEMISLVAELNDITNDIDANLSAYVIETAKNKRGPVVSVVVKSGVISIGDEIYAGQNKGKVKGLFDQFGQSIKELHAGEAAQLLGFSDLPPAGSMIASKPFISNVAKSVEEDESTEDRLPLLIRAAHAGALEAVEANIPEEFYVISSGVGDVTENDVFIAKSGDARIMVFESKVPGKVAKLAKTEGVKIETFNVIYKLLERLEKILNDDTEEVVGAATILDEFPYNKQRVAGSKVIQGTISKSDVIILLRGETEIGRTKIKSMRKEKKDVESVHKGEEFGLIMDTYLDFKPGDMLVSVRT